MKRARTRVQIVAMILMLLSWGASAYGQSDRVTITGTVTDPSGAVVPSATVTATDPNTKAVFTAATNGNGVYNIPGLPIGVYTLEVTHPGFKSYQRTDISPEATQVLQVNVRLQVGSTTESVTVTGGVPPLQTQTSNEATTMEEYAIRELPLDAAGGRSPTQLILATTPNIAANWSYGEGGQNWISIAGGAQMTNAAFIDGVDATNSYQGGISAPGRPVGNADPDQRYRRTIERDRWRSATFRDEIRH